MPQRRKRSLSARIALGASPLRIPGRLRAERFVRGVDHREQRDGGDSEPHAALGVAKQQVERSCERCPASRRPVLHGGCRRGGIPDRSGRRCSRPIRASGGAKTRRGRMRRGRRSGNFPMKFMSLGIEPWKADRSARASLVATAHHGSAVARSAASPWTQSGKDRNDVGTFRKPSKSYQQTVIRLPLPP